MFHRDNRTNAVGKIPVRSFRMRCPVGGTHDLCDHRHIRLIESDMSRSSGTSPAPAWCPLLVALVIAGCCPAGPLASHQPGGRRAEPPACGLDQRGSHLDSPAVPDPPSHTYSSPLLTQLGQLHRLLRVLTSRSTGRLRVVGTSVTDYYLAVGYHWPRWSSTRDIIRPGGRCRKNR